jgi:Sec-independent protein secretion pathway component TatC
MAVPMYVLYEFGIVLSSFLGKRRAADKTRHEAAQSGE